MADNNEVLGISAQLDITQIEQSINNLCSSLERVGVETDTLSSNMTKALNDISSSNDDLSTKTQQSMSVLQQAMEAAKAGMADVPAMIQLAQSKVDSYTQSIDSLRVELSSTESGSVAMYEVTKQIESQEEALRDAQATVEDLCNSYARCQSELDNTSNLYNALSVSAATSAGAEGAQSAANLSTGVTASASAVATSAQAAAHLSNASAAQQDTEATQAQINSTKTLTESIQEYISVANGRVEVEMLQNDSASNLVERIKEYKDAIKNIQEQLNNTDWSGQIEDIGKRIEGQKEILAKIQQEASTLNPSEDPDGKISEYYDQQIEKVQERIATLQEQLEGLQSTHERLNSDLENYNTLLGAAQQIANGQSLVVDSNMSYAELNVTLDQTQAKLQSLQAQAEALRSADPTLETKQKLEELNSKIASTQEYIDKLKEAIREERGETFVGTLRNKLDDLGNKISETKDKIVDGLTKPFTDLADKIANSSFGQRFSAEMEQVSGLMGDAKQKVIDLATGHGKLQQSYDNLNTALKGMGLPLTGALTGIKSVTKALWSMCATPIGAVLTAIVLALKAIHTWMTKSAAGQVAYTKLMAYFGSLAKSITDIVIILGEYLFNCFTKPSGPLKAFGEAFVTTFKLAVETVAALLKGLFHTLKGVFTLDWNTFTQGLSEIGGGAVKLVETALSAMKTQMLGITGTIKAISDLSNDGKTLNKLGGIFSGMTDNASFVAEYAGKIAEHEIKIAQAKEKQASLDKDIAEKQNLIYKLTGKAKDAELENLKKLKEARYKDEINAQRQICTLLSLKNNLHEESVQDIGAERDANIKLLRLEAQRESSQRMLIRMQESNRRKMASDARSAQKTKEREAKAAERQANQDRNKGNKLTSANNAYDELIYKNDNARETVIADLEAKIANAKIAAMQDGFAKTKAERKRQQAKEFEDLQKQEEAALQAEYDRQKKEFDAIQEINKAKGGTVKEWDPETSFDKNTDDIKNIQAKYDELRTYLGEKQVRDEEKIGKQVVKTHQSFVDKKLEAEEKYKQELQSIDDAIAEARERNDTKMIESLQRTRNQAVADYGKNAMKLELDELKNSSDYVAAFTNIKKASTDTLNALLERFDKVKNAAASTFDTASAKTYFDTISKLTDELIARDPVGAMRQLTEQAEKQKKEYDEAVKTLETLQNGGQVVKKHADDTSEGKSELVDEYVTLAEATEQVNAKSVELGQTLSNIDKATQQRIKGIQNLSSAFSSLGNSVKGEAGQVLNLMSSVTNLTITTINSFAQVSETASKSMKALQTASIVVTVIATAISLISKMTSLFKSSDDYYESYAKKYKEINKLRQAVDEYKSSVIAARQEEKNWFSTTGLQSLQDAWEKHAQAEKNYYNTLLESQEIYKDKSSGISKIAVPLLAAAGGAVAAVTGGLGGVVAGIVGSAISATAAGVAAGAVGAIAGSALGSAAQSAIDNITYQDGHTAAMENLRIQTRHRTWFRSQKTQDLREWVRENFKDDAGNPAELFDDQLLVNLEVAKTIVEKYGDKLQGETKETLEMLIKQREQYDEYLEELQDYVSQTYSPLVDNMTDAIWSWLADGKDALAEFKDSASSTFQSIGKEMIKQMLLKTVFDGFQDKLTDIYKKYSTGEYDDAQLAEQMGEVMGSVVDSMNTELPGLEKFAENYRDIMAKYGFDVTGNTSQSATSKGVTSITYDQANLLVNLATARNIALEKGNAVREQILDALINKGYVAEETIPTTTDDKALAPSDDGNYSTLQAVWGMISQIVDDDTLPNIQSDGNNDYTDVYQALCQQLYDMYNNGTNVQTSYAQMLATQQEMSVDVVGLRASTSQIQSDVSVMRDIQEQGLTQITKIELNTRPISQILEVVNDIYRYQKNNM